MQLQTLKNKGVIKLKIEDIAMVAHAVKLAYCEATGDLTQVLWQYAPAWQKNSALLDVNLHLNNPETSASKSHEIWLEQKLNDGWKYGPRKDAELKLHPCVCSFEELTKEQQIKDHLFKAVVNAITLISEQSEE